MQDKSYECGAVCLVYRLGRTALMVPPLGNWKAEILRAKRWDHIFLPAIFLPSALPEAASVCVCEAGTSQTLQRDMGAQSPNQAAQRTRHSATHWPRFHGPALPGRWPWRSVMAYTYEEVPSPMSWRDTKQGLTTEGTENTEDDRVTAIRASGSDPWIPEAPPPSPSTRAALRFSVPSVPSVV